MNIDEYLEQMKEIQEKIIQLLDTNEDSETHFENLQKILEDFKIRFDKQKIKSLLYLIARISQHHFQYPSFYDKLLKILMLFIDEIKLYFSSSEVLKIFQKNKRIILFFIEEEIIMMNEQIAEKMISNENYIKYFYPELKHFMNKEKRDHYYREEYDESNLEQFNAKRKIGKNDNYIAQLIQNDSIAEFVEHVNKSNISIEETYIPKSIFETNSLLAKFNTPLLNYTLFYGSIQIFKYLYLNGAKLSPYNWIYAIHGRNHEIIHFLEEKKIEPNIKIKILKTAIKCHHNEIAVYIIENYLYQKIEPKFFKFYNFFYIKKEMLNSATFVKLCQYDHYYIVKYLLESGDIDVNIIHSILKNILFIHEIYIIFILILFFMN
ncbi:hypothetical protein M9Y10_035742 [Tritrichomonas musculus]|uniref:DUF3447 domain-containing protein n=1 Tax=Tritrichomonas musculus TaxID=1915356 RepID=A0ABR2GWM7_9EUKA